jgi:UDP-N-acetylmuramoylalanine-D-glutamate ligase
MLTVAGSASPDAAQPQPVWAVELPPQRAATGGELEHLARQGADAVIVTPGLTLPQGAVDAARRAKLELIEPTPLPAAAAASAALG